MMISSKILMGMLKTYLHSSKGATAIEYGLIVAGIAVAISGSVFFFGDAVSNLLYADLPEALSGPTSP